MIRRRKNRSRGNPSDKRNRWRHILSRERGLCFWCDQTVERSGLPNDNAPNAATMDHIKPAARGGTCRLSNIVLACFACNAKRGNMPAHHWAKRKNKTTELRRFLSGEYQAENLERVRSEHAKQQLNSYPWNKGTESCLSPSIPPSLSAPVMGAPHASSALTE